MEPLLRYAAQREAGARCPHCSVEVAMGDAIAQCPACATCHHQQCWNSRGGCGAYSCAPARRGYVPVAPGFEPIMPEPVLPAWRITTEELGSAVLLPTRPAAIAGSYGQRPPPPQRPPSSRTSGLAIAALVAGIVGIPLFGIVTGLVAVVLGVLALSETTRKRRKGTGLAVTGLVLGLADAVAWSFLMFHLMNGGGGFFNRGHRTGPNLSDFKVDPRTIDALPAPVARAMRANVLLSSRSTFGESIGSGIILKLAGGQAQILTNRHVVDPNFESDNSDRDPASLKPLDVALHDQSRSQGKVVWLAPGGVDLAVVSAPVGPAARATAWPATRPTVGGDPVFAIGNPQGWGWSQTQGFISQFRTVNVNDREVSVIQSSAPINPGNSGGGLYDRDGFLIGVNTWTYDKRVSEGLSFSISLKAFMELAPPELRPTPATVPDFPPLAPPDAPKPKEQEPKQP